MPSQSAASPRRAPARTSGTSHAPRRTRAACPDRYPSRTPLAGRPSSEAPSPRAVREAYAIDRGSPPASSAASTTLSEGRRLTLFAFPPFRDRGQVLLQLSALAGPRAALARRSGRWSAGDVVSSSTSRRRSSSRPTMPRVHRTTGSGADAFDHTSDRGCRPRQKVTEERRTSRTVRRCAPCRSRGDVTSR